MVLGTLCQQLLYPTWSDNSALTSDGDKPTGIMTFCHLPRAKVAFQIDVTYHLIGTKVVDPNILTCIGRVWRSFLYAWSVSLEDGGAKVPEPNLQVVEEDEH
ncbi:hypothetical protein Salat_0286300 [Sesamum alatum]|uniref:Uncharacterized protein n=1 Tax=Sesamum alatum TaxID=300844 RepID=A0AAE1YZT3_9LAMI|nr:hypothetical protein Salat_0286300 [Sesamum alatum]